MKHVLLMAGYLILLASCKKEEQPAPTVKGEKKVRIDQFALKQFDHVELSALVEGIPEGEIWLRGFTWSLDPERRVGDSLYKIFLGESFSAHINGIGQNSRIYLRAFVETSQETYFSDSIVINTRGLQLLWNREHRGPRRRVKQVISAGNDGFVVLVERMDDGHSWPGLMKIDSAGAIIWDRVYPQNSIMTPQYLQPVSDGYLMAAGADYSSISGGILIVKTDLAGTKLWEKVFTQQTYEDFIRLTVLPNQTVQLTTRGYSEVVNNKRVQVAINNYVFDGNGQLIGTTSVPANAAFSDSYNPIRALSTADGGFVSASEISSESDGVVVNKFNNGNQVEWEQFYLRTTGKLAGISVNQAGNYMVRGSFLSNTVVMEIDRTSGRLLWQYDFDVWKYKAAYGEGSLAAGNDGYYIAADGRLIQWPYLHGALLFKLGLHGELLYDFMQVISDADQHFTDVVVTNANKEIYLFGTKRQQMGGRTDALFIIKLKEP